MSLSPSPTTHFHSLMYKQVGVSTSLMHRYCTALFNKHSIDSGWWEKRTVSICTMSLLWLFVGRFGSQRRMAGSAAARTTTTTQPPPSTPLPHHHHHHHVSSRDLCHWSAVPWTFLLLPSLLPRSIIKPFVDNRWRDWWSKGIHHKKNKDKNNDRCGEQTRVGR